MKLILNKSIGIETDVCVCGRTRAFVSHHVNQLVVMEEKNTYKYTYVSTHAINHQELKCVVLHSSLFFFSLSLTLSRFFVNVL